MKILLISLLLIASIYSAEVTEEDNVVVLNQDNFDEFVSSQEFVMVEFYAPWCGHCKHFAPEYSKAAEELKKKGEGYVPLTKVDATANEALAQRYEIQEKKGFPTVKFFSKSLGLDKPINYEGQRTAQDVIAWITKKTGPVSLQLTTTEEVDAFVQSAEKQPVVVYFGASEEDAEFGVFKAFAATQEKIIFAHSFLPEARGHLNVTDNVKVVLFKNFDEKRNEFTGNINEEELKEFTQANSVPTLLPFNEQAIQVIFQQQNNALILFFNENEASVNAFEAFQTVAPEFKSTVKFTHSSPNDGIGLFQKLAEYIGADQNALPNIMLITPKADGAKYKYTTEITVENLRSYLQEFKDGKLERYLKSEPIPETNDQPVKIVVSKNFQELVIDNEKDILVEFYAPWCGHCKQLAPIYEKAAEILQVNKNIVIAKCDATANEIASVEIKSFPTLKFWKNGQKDQAIAFTGERDLKGILKFIEDNTSHPWVELPKQETPGSSTEQNQYIELMQRWLDKAVIAGKKLYLQVRHLLGV